MQAYAVDKSYHLRKPCGSTITLDFLESKTPLNSGGYLMVFVVAVAVSFIYYTVVVILAMTCIVVILAMTCSFVNTCNDLQL